MIMLLITNEDSVEPHKKSDQVLDLPVPKPVPTYRVWNCEIFSMGINLNISWIILICSSLDIHIQRLVISKLAVEITFQNNFTHFIICNFFPTHWDIFFCWNTEQMFILYTKNWQIQKQYIILVDKHLHSFNWAWEWTNYNLHTQDICTLKWLQKPNQFLTKHSSECAKDYSWNLKRQCQNWKTKKNLRCIYMDLGERTLEPPAMESLAQEGCLL